MARNRKLLRWSCSILCCVALIGCIGESIDRSIVTFERAIDAIDRNSKSWQITIAKLEQDLIAQGQSTLANEVQSLSNRTIARSGTEIRCNGEFIGRRVNQGLRRIAARLKKEPIPPLAPGLCTVDPEDIKIDLIRQGRLSSINYYGYDFFGDDASDSQLRVLLRYKTGREQDITFAMALPTHYLMNVRLVDDRIKLSDDPDKLIILWGEDSKPVSIINFIPPSVPPKPIVVNNLQVTFQTNDDDKDDNTGVSVNIPNVTDWHQERDEKFPDGSNVTKYLNPNSVQLAKLTGNTLEVCISPVGDDTWRFNMTLSGILSDRSPYTFSAYSIQLNEEVRCKQWNLP